MGFCAKLGTEVEARVTRIVEIYRRPFIKNPPLESGFKFIVLKMTRGGVFLNQNARASG
jgi:hypothetical protein